MTAATESSHTDPSPAPQQPVGSPPRKGLGARLKGYGQPPRLMGLDIARGLALIGMIAAHVGDIPDSEWSDPSTWGGLVHGRSSILFAVLAGISITLMTGRTRGLAPEDVIPARLRLAGRGAAIFLIGLVLELLGTPIAVILTFYGVLFIGAIPFLRWSARKLLITAAVIGLVGPALLALIQTLSYQASGPGVDLMISGVYPVTVWIAMLLTGMGLGRWGLERTRAAVTLLVAGIALAVIGYCSAAALAPDYDEDGKDSWGSEEPIDDGGLYGVPGTDIDISGLVCDLYEDEWVNCYPSEYMDEASIDMGSDGSSLTFEPGSFEEEYAEDDDYSYGDMLREADIPQVLWTAVISDYPHSGGTAEIIGSGGFAIAVIGLCLLLARPLRWPLIPLAALGSMPLTIYAGHIVVIAIAIGGPTGDSPHEEIHWHWLIAALIAFATAWALLWGRGPLERLVGRAADAMARVRG